MIEILSPAKNEESLIAAVRTGADAVYLGAKAFNARINTDNFDTDSLYNAVRFCRERGVKVYLTLNTLISDHELENALMLVKTACEIPVDGVIVQDLGLIHLLKEAASEMPVFASTQMSIHSPSGIIALSKLNISRVVLARELSKTEIEKIGETAKEHNISLEMFVHGALCMSVSGQCYMSVFYGGRSGNRGECAGPCRLPSAPENMRGHALSLKDLCLLRHMEEIQKLPVSSLKIEGRMKNAEYTAAATYTYKNAQNGGNPDENDEKVLKDVFSRSGFTDGYFSGKREDMFGIRSDENMGETAEILSSIHEFYRNERQSIPLSFLLEIKENQSLKLKASDGIFEVLINGETPQKAINRPIDEEFAKKQLSKLGNTPFFLSNFDFEADENLSVSASTLNSLRREAVESLLNKRGEKPPVNFVFPKISFSKAPDIKPKLISRFSSLSQIPENFSGECFVPLESDLNEIKKLIDKGIFVGADIPRTLFDSDDWTEKRLSEFKKIGARSALCGNLGAVILAQNAGLEAFGSFGLNIYNSYAQKAAEELGLSASILSPELSLSDAQNINGNIPRGMFAYGHFPLMLTRNCPLKNFGSCEDCGHVLYDRKKAATPVLCRRGIAEIFNSLAIWSADRLNEMHGLDFLLLYFTIEDKTECEKIINAYENGGKPPEKFTRGRLYNH